MKLKYVPCLTVFMSSTRSCSNWYITDKLWGIPTELYRVMRSSPVRQELLLTLSQYSLRHDMKAAVPVHSCRV